MSKTLKKIPRFRSEEAERSFWESHDTTDYLDWSKAQRARFPNLKLSHPLDLSRKIKKKRDGH
jgi:CopG antitoxin of type II toxin-antitoxin system